MVTEEKSKDLRSAADIAMARHVDNFEIPAADAGAVDSPEIAAEIAAEIKELKLPKTLKATHQLLQEILAIEPATQRAEVVKRGKLSFVRSYLSELEQGAPAPVISMAAHKEITGRQSEHANDLHLQELAKVHPEVRAVVMERDALLKDKSSLIETNAKLVAENTALKAANSKTV